MYQGTGRKRSAPGGQATRLLITLAAKGSCQCPLDPVILVYRVEKSHVPIMLWYRLDAVNYCVPELSYTGSRH